MTFVGLDLHKRYLTACALDASGTVLAEVRQMAVSLESLSSFLSALPAPVTVALESCLYWPWLHDQLEAQGHTVRVADPRQVKVIWQARSKTDPIRAVQFKPPHCLVSLPGWSSWSPALRSSPSGAVFRRLSSSCPTSRY